MKDLKEIAKLVDYLHCRPFEGSKRKLLDHWIAYVKETRFEFEVSSNEQWAKKLNHFLWVRSIFMAREDRLKDGTKMEELNDKIMMCGLFNTWANYAAEEKEETRFEFEVSSNEQWAKKLNHFLWVRSIFIAREDRLKDGTKMEELNDKIMMCDLLNTWASYVAVNKERGYGTLPMRVFIHDSYRLRSMSLEHVRLDFMECWRSWCYHMLDKKYNPEYDDCVDHECKLCLL